MRYIFEWDATKACSNIKKHGIAFDEAATIFMDSRMLSLFDSEHNQDEERWITLGISSLGRLLVVCHTFRKEDFESESAAIRIYSARKASKHEQKQYTENNK